MDNNQGIKTPVMLAKVFAVAALTFGMMGCASTSKTNADMYESSHDLFNRVDQLHVGMTLDEVKAVMGDRIEGRWLPLNNPDKNSVYCGCVLQVPSMEEARKVNEKVVVREGYQFIYKDITEEPKYFGTKKRVVTKGDEAVVRFLFDEEGKLIAWDKNGIPVNSQRSKPYIDFDGVDLDLNL